MSAMERTIEGCVVRSEKYTSIEGPVVRHQCDLELIVGYDANSQRELIRTFTGIGDSPADGFNQAMIAAVRWLGLHG